MRRARDDERAHLLAHHRIGHRDARRLGDAGMGDEQRFDLLRRDVLAAADDDVLQPVDDREVLAVVHREVAGAEPAVVDERVGVERRVEVADEHLGPAREQLARRAGATSASVSGSTMRSSAAPISAPVGRRVAFGIVAERGRS